MVLLINTTYTLCRYLLTNAQNSSEGHLPVPAHCPMVEAYSLDEGNHREQPGRQELLTLAITRGVAGSKVSAMALIRATVITAASGPSAKYRPSPSYQGHLACTWQTGNMRHGL